MQHRSSFLLVLAALASAPVAAQAEASYLLQLGSFPTDEAAQEKWKALKSDYASQLEGLDMRLSEVPIGGGKSIYRLQAGPLTAKETASDRCAALKAAKQDCYLVETAVLSNEAPKQALSSVRASSAADTSAELQLGKQGLDSDSLIRLDTALPRAANSAPVAIAAREEIASAKPIPAEVITPDSPPSLPPVTLADDRLAEATSATPPLPPEPSDALAAEQVEDFFKPLDAPSAANLAAAPRITHAAEQPLAFVPAPASAAIAANSDSLQTLAAHPDGFVGDTSKDYVAPATSPMGSLGTLRMNQQGEVVSAAAAPAPVPAPVPVEHAAPIAPAPMKAARIVPTQPELAAPAPSPVANSFAPAPTSIAAPTSVALLAPPPVSLNSPVRTQQAPLAASPSYIPPVAAAAPAYAPAPVAAPQTIQPSFHQPGTLGTLTASSAKDVKVEVREAVRVKESMEPMAPIASDPQYAAPAPQPIYTAPAAWRGTPGSDTTQGMVWVQFGKFVQEDVAFAYFDQLRSARPDLTNGVRVRALRPYSSMGIGRHVSLRVGPYRSDAEAESFCSFVQQETVPCSTVREMGLSTFSGGGRQPAPAQLNRASTLSQPAVANPFVAPGKHWVQVGSYATENDAYNRYSSLKASMPKLFIGMQPNVSAPKATSSNKPSHRLRVGPFQDQTAASGFCNTLGQNGVSCLIVSQ